MKQTKKWIALLLALAMVFALVGCGGGEAEEEGQEGLRIVQVSSGAGIDDGSFNQNVYEGIVAFMESRGNIDTFNDVLDSTGDPAAAVQAVADIVADYDVIVTPGFQFAGITSIAQENPDKMFIIVDSFPSDENGATIELPNVYGMLFTEHEGGFFAGIAAAMTSKTGKVASVHGIAFESNVNYQWGFESGVAYANKHFGTAVEVVELPAYAGTDVTGLNVGGNYVGSFADPATGKVIAEALIAQGVDVIFPAGGSSGNGCITAAKEAEGVYFIGCDADQYKDGAKGDANICLTSALKVMDINVERQLNAIVDGTFEGGNVILSADTGSTGYVTGEHCQLSEEALAALEEVYALVQDGTIVPAGNFNGYTPENFPGL
ncbi:MAG: BMP family ABC transporter substrate-binding protein [Firmicutes bacterium]|nr:BMP family ABC transporter substrate-binding protein [Bacillota bacterium]MBQ5797232.1 BMP family ABC transporter substrate-binding protein [Bacillota bacterium]